MSYNQVVGPQNPNVWIRGELANTNSGSSNYAINYGGGITYGGEGFVDGGMSYPGGASIRFDFANDPDPSYTISGWWKPVDGGNSEFMRSALRTDNNTYNSISVNTDGLVWFRASDGTSFTASTIKLNTWNHIAIRSNPDDPFGGVDIYVNGVRTNVSDVNNFMFDASVTLGYTFATGGNPAGFDEMAFWNRSLSESEILAQYNSSYMAVILSQSVVEYLPYGSGKSGTALADWTQGATQSSSPGIFGRAFVGAGSNEDNVRKGGRNGGTTTQTFWIKTTQASGFIMQYQNTAASSGWALYFVDGKLRYGSSTTGTRANSTTSINDGNWHHVALVIGQISNDDRLKIYVDGVQEFTGNVSTVTSTTLAMWVVGRTNFMSTAGATAAVAPAFNGLLDEVAFFDRNLTPAEIQQQYAARPQVYTPPTVVDAKVTTTPVALAFTGTTNNMAYQFMDTTSISGYRSKVQTVGNPIWYTDGLSATNIGTEGGAFTSSNATFQSQGKFTGGIRVGTSSPATKGYVSFNRSTTTAINYNVSFWFKASAEMYARQIWSFRNSTTGLIEELSIGMDGKLYYSTSGQMSTLVRDVVVANNVWHHVVLAAGVNGRIFIDAVAGITRGNLGTPVVTSYISSNNPTDMLAVVGSVVVFDEYWANISGTALSQTQISELYNFKETKQKGEVASFGLFGTTNNNIRGVRGVLVPITAGTIGFNGTNNNTARVSRRELVTPANATFNGVNAVISSTRNYRFQVPAGTTSFFGTNNNRGYTPIANNKAEPAFVTFSARPANVFTPVNRKVTATTATISFTGTTGVAKTRTDRTVTTNAGTTLVRGVDTILPKATLNNNNRWYQQILSTYIAKSQTVVAENYNDPSLGATALQWYKFEGEEPPYLPAVGANGASTGEVGAMQPYQMNIDAGHTRQGIKFSNGGYFKTRVTYPFLIPGAQQQLLGGLKTHYTAEFAFRAYAPGAICNGVRINAAGKLEFLQTNGYWYELRTEYANLLDGQWHHMVFISPQAYFVPPESNPDRNFVLVDGKVVSAVHAPVYVPNTWGYDTVTGANPQIDFDDIIIHMFRIISTSEAAKLYYEYSEAVITNAGVPARMTLRGTNDNRPKGNVLRVLALYGSPAGYTTNGGEIFKYMNEYSSFKISNGTEAQNSPTGFQNDGGRGDTFRYNGMLVFPVGYTARNASAAGVLDTNRANYVDDKTGYTRLIDFDNDFAIDPADFDIVTVVRWPSMQDSLVTRPFLNSGVGSSNTNQAQGAEPNDILLARRNTIEKFALGILKLANKGVSVWVQDPATAQGLGLITGYTDIQDRMTERSEDDGTPNQGARETELKYNKTPLTFSPNTPGYADTGHNVWKRRVTAVIPNLTDVPSWNTIDSVEWRDANVFAAHAVQYRRKYRFFSGMVSGDEFAVISDANIGAEFTYAKGFVSADPTGYIGTPVTMGQNVVSTKAGTNVANPYKDRIMTLAVEAGTVIKNIKINARIFAEFNEKQSQPTVLMGNDKSYNNGRPLLPNETANDWDYDSTRENQIVANYALERFRNNTYIGAEAQPYIVYGNGVPSYFYTSLDMHTRGIKWLQAYEAPSAGDSRVQATAASVTVRGTTGSAVRNTRNTRVKGEVARTRFEFTMPKNYNNTNPRVTGFPATVAFNGVDIQAIVKVNVGTIVMTAPNTRTSGDGQDLVLYYSNWAPALYKEEI